MKFRVLGGCAGGGVGLCLRRLSGVFGVRE
jgi:hypothetical protein